MTTKQQLIDWLATSTTRRVVLVEIEGVLDSTGTSIGNQYFSNKPYGTTSTDTPANILYQACINGGVTFSETLDLDGRASLGFGDIQLDNTDGSRDSLLTWIWVNKPVKVYIGDASWPKADFYQIFSGFVADIDSKNRNSINIILVDKLQQLNVAVTETLIGGTGTTKDQLNPLCFGECFNVTPVVLNSSTLTYQVHNGTIDEIIEVRDNGAVVAFETATVSGVPQGTFNLLATPFGTITASVRGAKPDGINFSAKIGSIINNLLQNYGKTVNAVDIDTTNFNNFDSTASSQADVGVYLQNRENVLDVCQRLASSVGGYLTTGIDGKFKLVQLKVDLQEGSQAYSVGPQDMEERSLTISQKVPVQGAIKLGYSKNWTVQTSGLASGLLPGVVSVFSKDYNIVYSKNTTVLTRYAQSAEPVLKETLLLTTAKAEDEASRLLNIYSTPRFIYSANYYPHMLLCELGDIMKITNSRFGLSNGKIGTIVKIDRDWLRGRVNIGVFV